MATGRCQGGGYDAMGPCEKSQHGFDPAGTVDIHPVCRSVRALMRQAADSRPLSNWVICNSHRSKITYQPLNN